MSDHRAPSSPIGSRRARRARTADRRGPPRPARTPRPWFRLNAAPEPGPQTRPLHRRLAWLIGAAFAALVLAIALGPHRIGDNFTETDFYGGYADGARAIQRGHIDAARYGVVGPGYEVALALAGWVVRDPLLAAELIAVLSATAALLLWFHLLALRGGGRLALLAMLFLAVHPTFIRYGFSATTDALALMLQAAALFLLLAASGTRAPLLAGMVAGLAFLTRYSAIVLLPAGLVAVAAGGTLQARRGRAALLFALGFAAPVVPWTAWSLAHGARFASQLHHNIAYDVFARSRGMVWDDYQEQLQPQFRSLWDVIARDPAAVLRRELFNVWDHLRLDAVKLMGMPMAIAAAAGTLFALGDGTARRLWPVLLVAALLFLSLVPAFYAERYSLALLPVHATLAAAAFASPLLALQIGRERGLWLKPLLVAVPLALTAIQGQRTLARVLDQLPVEVLDASATLRRAARPGDRVVARKPHVGWHAGVDVAPFPFAHTLAELAAGARQERARWLFFSWPEAQLRPEFSYLLDTTAVVPGLSVQYASRGRPLVLYEIGPVFGANPVWMANDTLVAWHRARAQLLINPQDPAALATVAFIRHTQRGEHELAREAIERSLRVRPGDVPSWLLLGRIALRLADPARAAVAYERALALDPRNAEAQVGRGWASLAARRPEEAAALWRPVIEATTDPVTLQRMIEVFAALGDAGSAERARHALRALGTAR
jgi:tetratricopeptide (TPR) repeat protein